MTDEELIENLRHMEGPQAGLATRAADLMAALIFERDLYRAKTDRLLDAMAQIESLPATDDVYQPARTMKAIASRVLLSEK